MKRFVMSTVLIAALFFHVSVSAAQGDFYCTYSPKSEKSSMFCIDVYCKREVCAALFELEYDSGAAEYRSVEAGSSDTEASGNVSGDKVVIAFADNSSKGGKLCAVSFKALRTGDCGFRLHMKQAVDGDHDYLNDFADYSLSVTFDKDDVVESDPSKSSKGSDKTDSTSKMSSKSVKTDRSSVSEEDEDSPAEPGGLYNVSGSDPGKYILIGAGSLALVAAVAAVGYLLGKKALIKKKSEEAPEEALSENNGINGSIIDLSDDTADADADDSDTDDN